MLRNFLNRLNPQALRSIGLVLLCLLLLVAARQLVSYASAHFAHRRDARQQAQAKGEHLGALAASQAAHVAYQLDSARYATLAHSYFLQDSTYRRHDAELQKNRPPRLVLPAASELPHERPE